MGKRNLGKKTESLGKIKEGFLLDGLLVVILNKSKLWKRTEGLENNKRFIFLIVLLSPIFEK